MAFHPGLHGQPVGRRRRSPRRSRSACPAREDRRGGRPASFRGRGRACIFSLFFSAPTGPRASATGRPSAPLARIGRRPSAGGQRPHLPARACPQMIEQRPRSPDSSFINRDRRPLHVERGAVFATQLRWIGPAPPSTSGHPPVAAHRVPEATLDRARVDQHRHAVPRASSSFLRIGASKTVGHGIGALSGRRSMPAPRGMPMPISISPSGSNEFGRPVGGSAWQADSRHAPWSASRQLARAAAARPPRGCRPMSAAAPATLKTKKSPANPAPLPIRSRGARGDCHP